MKAPFPYFDDEVARRFWIWAASCWIGEGLTRPVAVPDITNAKGVHAAGPGAPQKRPHLGHGRGVCQLGARPQVGVQGAGVHVVGQIPEIRDDVGVHQQRPQVTENSGINTQIPSLRDDRGINTDPPLRVEDICRRPSFGPMGAHGVHRISLFEESTEALDVRDPYTPGLWVWFRQLAECLRRVRVVCGDWTRICGGDWQDDRGTCGIFFDPPYSAAAGRDPRIYQEESLTVANDVREWCRTRAARKTYRIVLAGYFEEHECLLEEGWTVHRWSAHGGFANRGKSKTQGAVNRHKEALFFSPHCHSSGLRRFGVLEERGSSWYSLRPSRDSKIPSRCGTGVADGLPGISS